MTDIHIQYIRVSADHQNQQRQVEGLAGLGIAFDLTFQEKVSGKSMERPELVKMLQVVEGMGGNGKSIHVHIWELSRLGRNLQDLLSIVSTIREAGATITFHKENISLGPDGKSNAMQTLMFQMFSAFAEFERSHARERMLEGVAVAKKAGKYKGRPSRFSEEEIAGIKESFTTTPNKNALAKRLGISRSYLYRLVKD